MQLYLRKDWKELEKERRQTRSKGECQSCCSELLYKEQCDEEDLRIPGGEKDE